MVLWLKVRLRIAVVVAEAARSLTTITEAPLALLNELFSMSKVGVLPGTELAIASTMPEPPSPPGPPRLSATVLPVNDRFEPVVLLLSTSKKKLLPAGTPGQ